MHRSGWSPTRLANLPLDALVKLTRTVRHDPRARNPAAIWDESTQPYTQSARRKLAAIDAAVAIKRGMSA